MIDTMEKMASILAEFGVEIAPGGIPVIADLHKADRGYLHHSRIPVAVTALALVSPALAKGRFVKMGLSAVVAGRVEHMDESEALALAAVCGVVVAGPIWGRGGPFAAHLKAVIERYDLGALFGQAPRPAMNGIDIRPTGIDPVTDEVMPAKIKAWQKAYRALPPAKQMMAATIVWLYRAGDDKVWLSRRFSPSVWHAADAIAALRYASMLQDWAKLVALYPGW